MQQAVLGTDPRLASALAPLGALHVTLGVLRINSDAERAAAVGVLERLAPRLHAALPPWAPLRLDGVDSFRDRVVYGALDAAHPGTDALRSWESELRAALADAGVCVGEHQGFTPHMTLLKLGRALCREIGSIDRAAWMGLRRMHFGEQPVTRVDLCWMGQGQTRQGAYYSTIASVRLGRLLQPVPPLMQPPPALPLPPPSPLADGASTLAPAELHIYDFDGTVFQTLGPREVPERYRELTGRPWPHRGWPLSHAASLPKRNTRAPGRSPVRLS